jgi:Xaa-Pro aminopeptidase
MLTKDGCLTRQDRLRQYLIENHLDAALITDRHDIYYFTGKLLPVMPVTLPGIFWLRADGETFLIAPEVSYEPYVNEFIAYSHNSGGTSHPDLLSRANALFQSRLSGQTAKRIGYQIEFAPLLMLHTATALLHVPEWVAIDQTLQRLQIRKDADELALIKKAVAINLAAYDAAQKMIVPGVRECDVFAAAKQATVIAAGEDAYHNGDYQCGVGGGFARDRQIQAGELYIIDAWTNYRGYWSDLSRVFIVGDTVTDLQQSVFEHIKAIFADIPAQLKPGVDGTALYHWLDARLRQHPAIAGSGLTHHAGHNLGLRAHEQPDMNPERGGILEVGCVITMEPGVYLPALNAGFRIENMYLVTEKGGELLSEYPIELHPKR